MLSQTERRVLRGERVAASDKIVSIFEPPTDIIIKDNRDTCYGHKVCLTAGASNLVIDLVVQEGNPPDSKLAAHMVQRQEQIYGRPPRQAAFDGGFASRANLEALKELGVEDVAFSTGRGLSQTEMASSTRGYRRHPGRRSRRRHPRTRCRRPRRRRSATVGCPRPDRDRPAPPRAGRPDRLPTSTPAH